jgi:hypothetical protein
MREGYEGRGGLMDAAPGCVSMNAAPAACLASKDTLHSALQPGVQPAALMDCKKEARHSLHGALSHFNTALKWPLNFKVWGKIYFT